MLKYTVKRLAQSLVTILLIATIVFLLMRCLPTDYYFTEEQLMKFTEEQKYAALEAAGLTDPIGTQLLHFYNDLLHLDFGTSRRIQNGASVVKVIGKKFGVSMRLGLISAGISLLVGIMLGILQTAFKDKVFDWIGTAYTVFVNAVPSLVSYSLVLVFGSKYLGFPTLYSTRNVGPSSVLPIVCLSLASIAGYALWTRRYMVDELTRDYIKLARVKGLSSSEIMFKHVLRNAMVPMVQYIPQSILLTVGGSLLMERFFSVPGMGPLLTDAIQRYDLNVVQTLVILYAALGIVGVFLGDVLMMLVDSYADFSGRGSRMLPYLKPDLVAPGVNIVAPVPGGGYRIVTGTSFAAPFVSGAAALLMQWGIVNGNDPIANNKMPAQP